MKHAQRLRAAFIGAGFVFVVMCRICGVQAYRTMSWPAVRFALWAVVALLYLAGALLLFFIATCDDLTLSKKNEAGKP